MAPWSASDSAHADFANLCSLLRHWCQRSPGGASNFLHAALPALTIAGRERSPLRSIAITFTLATSSTTSFQPSPDTRNIPYDTSPRECERALANRSHPVEPLPHPTRRSRALKLEPTMAPATNTLRDRSEALATCNVIADRSEIGRASSDTHQPRIVRVSTR